MIRGISVSNPVEVDRDYLLYTVEYAKQMGFDHLQVIGPIHDGVKGNIDGMTPYRKYARFDGTKDPEYIRRSLDAVNAACDLAKACGIRTYQWHHELDLPDGFQEAFPEIRNRFGDVEVTHPLIKDFLENKLLDFFHFYPNMDGIILTLHETKVPLLKLKDQKLGKVERVKYVTQILHDTCLRLGKELIVRPFASIEEDYVMMTKAYSEISRDLLVMDKWTQFDWSLTMPHNSFFGKIRHNPLFVEADIFGEFFGKGRLPLMLSDHISRKFRYCNTFHPAGYVARIDRAGRTPFRDVNQVNNDIFCAHLKGTDPESAIDAFFHKKYGSAGAAVKALMEPTEEILKKAFYIGGYYFTELSRFPTLNHSKNHFYFEMMRRCCDIASGEWFIPKDWQRPTREEALAEKEAACREAEALLRQLTGIRDQLTPGDYEALLLKFTNLKLVTDCWLALTKVFISYVNCLEEQAPDTLLETALAELLALREEGLRLTADAFYCLQQDSNQTGGSVLRDFIGGFAEEVRESFRLEKEARAALSASFDSIVCGGALEGHRLQKEVNFSDTLVQDGRLCRIPGNRSGLKWSRINAHGWFSYELRVRPSQENRITVALSSAGEALDVKITLGDREYEIRQPGGHLRELPLVCTPENDRIRIRFDKISGNTPCVHTICVHNTINKEC